MLHVLTTYNDLSSMPLFSPSGFILLPSVVVVVVLFVDILVVAFNGTCIVPVVGCGVLFGVVPLAVILFTSARETPE